MTVKDLIEKLKTFSADAQVLVQGYEDGFDKIKDIRQIAVVKKTEPRDWEGEYEDAGAVSCACPNNDAFSAVVILGNRR